MGYISLLNNNWSGATSSVNTALANSTTISFKLAFRGDLVNDLFAFQSANIIDITSSTGNFKLRANIGTGSPAVNANFGTTIDGDGATASIPMSSFNSNDYYIWYGHIRPTGIPTLYSEVFTSAGTSLGSGQITYGVTIQTGGGAVNMLNVGTNFQKLVGGVDALAIYTSVLSGADRYSKPSISDTGIAALYWFDETSGTTASAALGNPLSLSGAMNTDFSWQVGGIWDGTSANRQPTAGRYRRTGPLR